MEKNKSVVRLLLVTRQFPYPERDGESVAIQTMARALVDAGVEVHLFALNTAKHHYEGPLDHEALSHYTSITIAPIDNVIKPLKLITTFYQRTPYYISRYKSEHAANTFRDLLQKRSFDIIQFEGLQTMLYAPIARECSTAPIIFRPHNVENQIWRRFSVSGVKSLRDLYYRTQMSRLTSFESRISKEADHIISVSKEDQQWFSQYHDQVSMIPIAVPNAINRPTKSRVGVGFLGSLDWQPNQDGLKWYMEHIHGGVSMAVPGYQLIVAGRNAKKASWLKSINGVRVFGEIEDVNEFWQQVSLLIVPLWSGSGMRVKIIEAMENHTIVLTTSIGIEGIAAIDDYHAYISDSAREWILKIKHHLSQFSVSSESKIIENAYKLRQDQYSQDYCALRFLSIYEQALAN